MENFSLKKCLYCDETELNITFTSQEHVFPAGLGGIFQLPVGIVCDKCNTEVFSRLELDFIRNSIIGLPRQFYGPGKRGSLNPDDASSSLVHLMAFADDSNEKALGVMRTGIPFQIPQFRFLGSETVAIVLDPRYGGVDDQLADFSKAMRSFTGKSKFVYLTDELLQEDEMYFGFWEDKYYLCAMERRSVSSVLEYLDLVRKGELVEITERNYKKTQVQSRQRFGFNTRAFERVSAKIAFNALCFLNSSDFCRRPQFDSIRRFIANGGQNTFVSLLDASHELLNIHLNVAFPLLSHRVFFFPANEQGHLALLNFYGKFNIVIRLATKPTPKGSFVGIICDWRNRKDYVLNDYMKSF